MTVSNTNLRNNFPGNGSNVNFSFTFIVLEESNTFTVKVILTDNTTGVETIQTQDTHYTVTLNEDGTGIVTFVTAPTTNQTVTLLSNIPLTQETDYINIGTGKFPAASHEAALDKLTLISQQQAEAIDRAVGLPDSSPLTNLTIPVSVANADKVIVVNTDGDNLEAQNLADIGAAPVTDYAKTLLNDTTAAEARTTLDAQEDVITTQGDIIRGSSSGVAERLALGTTNQFLRSDGTDLIFDSFADKFNNNLIINGQGLIDQRGSSFTSNSDDSYLLDRQLYLASGADGADVSKETTFVPTGSPSAIKYLQATANIQTSYCQIIEGDDAAAIIGGTASLSFKAAKGGSNATLGTLRAALISWDSTKDVVTSDVVATWNGAGTDPDLATNWTYENTPSDLTLTTSYQTFKVENVSIDTASTANVALFVWVDDVDATVSDEWYITDIKVEKGDVATDFTARCAKQELTLCQRYLPAFNSSGTTSWISSGFANSSIVVYGMIVFSTPARIAPSGITISASSHFSFIASASVFASTSTAFDSSSLTTARISLAVTGATAGNGGAVYFNNASGKLLFTGSEL